jgi:hypothetical protein
MQIRHVPRDVQSDDLPHAIIGLTKPADEPANDKAGMIDPFAEPDEIAIGPDVLGVTRKAEDDLLFLGREHRPSGQSIEEEPKVWPIGHTKLPGTQAGARTLSHHRSLRATDR